MNLFPAVVAVGLAFGLAVMARGNPPAATAASLTAAPPTKADRPTNGDRFLLRSPGNFACEVVKGAWTGGGSYALRPDEDCERLLPGLSQVRFWQERDDAVVVFSRDGTDNLVTFAVADGVAYESYIPTMPILSLAATD